VVGESALARGNVRRRHGAPLAPLGDLSRTIIDSVADFHEITERDGELCFAVLKRSRTSEAAP
jgi:hypothetical protein